MMPDRIERARELLELPPSRWTRAVALECLALLRNARTRALQRTAEQRVAFRVYIEHIDDIDRLLSIAEQRPVVEHASEAWWTWLWHRLW